MSARKRIQSRNPSVGGGGTVVTTPPAADIYLDNIGTVNIGSGTRIVWNPFKAGVIGAVNVQGDTSLRYKNSVMNVGTVNANMNLVEHINNLTVPTGNINIQGDTVARYSKFVQSVGTVNVAGETALRLTPLAEVTSVNTINGNTVLRWKPLVVRDSAFIDGGGPILAFNGDFWSGINNTTWMSGIPYPPYNDPVSHLWVTGGTSVNETCTYQSGVGRMHTSAANNVVQAKFEYGPTAGGPFSRYYDSSNGVRRSTTIDIDLLLDIATGSSSGPFVFSFLTDDSWISSSSRYPNNGYSVRFGPPSPDFAIEKTVAGTTTVLQSATINWTATDTWTVRIRISNNSTRFRARTWRPSFDSEPVGWTLDVTDTSLDPSTLTTIQLATSLNTAGVNVDVDNLSGTALARPLISFLPGSSHTPSQTVNGGLMPGAGGVNGIPNIAMPDLGLNVMFLYGTDTTDVNNNWNSDTNATARPDGTNADEAGTANQTAELRVTHASLSSMTGWTWIPTLTQVFMSGSNDLDGSGTSMGYLAKVGAAGTSRSVFGLLTADTRNIQGTYVCVPGANSANADSTRADIDALPATLAGLNDLLNGGYFSMRHVLGAVVAGHAHFDSVIWAIPVRDSNLPAPTITREMATGGAQNLTWIANGGPLSAANRRIENSGAANTMKAWISTTNVSTTGSFIAFFRHGVTRPAAGTKSATFEWWGDGNATGNPHSYAVKWTAAIGSGSDTISWGISQGNGTLSTVIDTVTTPLSTRADQNSIGDWFIVRWLADGTDHGSLSLWRNFTSSFMNTSSYVFNNSSSASNPVTWTNNGQFGISTDQVAANSPWWDDIFLVTGVTAI